MSYSLVINHINKVLNECGNNIHLVPTGVITISAIKSDLSIEIVTEVIKAKNLCFEIKRPIPRNPKTPPERYSINRIRISKRMINNYAKGNPYSDEELIHILKTKNDLFAYYN